MQRWVRQRRPSEDEKDLNQLKQSKSIRVSHVCSIERMVAFILFRVHLGAFCKFGLLSLSLRHIMAEHILATTNIKLLLASECKEHYHTRMGEKGFNNR